MDFIQNLLKNIQILNRIIEKAVKKYTRDVKLSKFPSNKNFLNGTKPETELEFKDKFNDLYNNHKVKIYIFIIFLIILLLHLFIQQKNEKNVLISEKYVQAGINISLDKNNEAKNILKKIILSENKFYSILALNSCY